MNLLSWGNFPKIENQTFEFSNLNELAKIVTQNDGMIPFGNGRSYGDSAISKRIIPMRSLNYFIKFEEEEGILELQAGVLLSEIVDIFVPRGWFIRGTPGTKLITIGGAIGSDVHGKGHHVEGCFSESVESFRLMLPTGEIKVCSRHQNKELFMATCGGMGLTGIILDARIRLMRIRSSQINQTTIKTENLHQTFEAFEENLDKPYSVAWIDCLARGKRQGRSLLMTGSFDKNGPLEYQPGKKLNVPFNFPAFTLNSLSVKTFNFLYYEKAKQGMSNQVVDIDTFFYPLDAIDNWNRIYGKKGFTQYQFILPKDSSFTGLSEILTAISNSGKGSFLAVLKLYGKANNNYLSFPMEGYGLALDFKIEKGLFSLLDRLDQIVLNYGGRIYLAKDVRVSQKVFEKGYPQIDKFRKIRSLYKMESKFNSLQSKRVGI